MIKHYVLLFSVLLTAVIVPQSSTGKDLIRNSDMSLMSIDKFSFYRSGLLDKDESKFLSQQTNIDFGVSFGFLVVNAIGVDLQIYDSKMVYGVNIHGFETDFDGASASFQRHLGVSIWAGYRVFDSFPLYASLGYGKREIAITGERDKNFRTPIIGIQTPVLFRSFGLFSKLDLWLLTESSPAVIMSFGVVLTP